MRCALFPSGVEWGDTDKIRMIFQAVPNVSQHVFQAIFGFLMGWNVAGHKLFRHLLLLVRTRGSFSGPSQIERDFHLAAMALIAQ